MFVVVVVVVVTVVVVVVIVVVVSRPYPTVPGQMANPIAVTAPSIGLALLFCLLFCILLVLFVLGKIFILSFSFLPDVQLGMGSYPPFNSIVKLIPLLCVVFDFDAFNTASIYRGKPPIYFSLIGLHLLGTYWNTSRLYLSSSNSSVCPWHDMSYFWIGGLNLGIPPIFIFLKPSSESRLHRAFEVPKGLHISRNSDHLLAATPCSIKALKLLPQSNSVVVAFGAGVTGVDLVLRDQAYENSLIYKERTKKIHDSKIKNRIFNVGDRVLLFNSCLKIFSGKLKTRWSGPFSITQVFPYGTIELSQTDGPNFKVNGHRVKYYFGGDIPSKVVPDLQTFSKDE
ncbi:hypothetical protein Tco_0628526 [Tanacetum coccineum]|uniref:Reverse transcriptase domain-containing protein n=1 Tax=Tanacetum coccineum TaxID=301880 RepID=A0ABQ4WQK2_9ASTR